MFKNTIDNKETIVDKNGNTIVNLVSSIFGKKVIAMNSYNSVRLTEFFQMRPDKVSFNEYGTTDNAEFILKYSGISNPFSLDKDDVLIIPEEEQAKAQMVDIEEKETNHNQVRNYYKFTNKDYQSNSKSYDDLENKEIKSGVKDPTELYDYIVPYISEDGKAAVTIRNGRMYFGEDAGQSAGENQTVGTALDKKIQSLIDSTATAVADNCALNGLSLTDFVRASTKNANEQQQKDI